MALVGVIDHHMSGAFIQLCLITAVLSAPIPSPLPDVQQWSDGQGTVAGLAECGKDLYWDSEELACKPCVFCPAGMGSTIPNCGNGVGARGICEDCKEGETFQDQTVTKGQCNKCRRGCDINASVLSNCTQNKDMQCGCNPGYTLDPNLANVCSSCAHFNDDEKPPECLITPTPVIVPLIDECALNQNTCDTSVSTCHNTVDSFTCECLPGYVMNRSDKCIDINECELDLTTCDASVSRCNNTNGSYTCNCLPGFETDSLDQCVDVNECELDLTTCDTSVSRCNNTNGNYTCNCLPGFKTNSSHQCVDVNECELDLNTCDDSVSRCNNTNGNYTCNCLPGFETDSLDQCVGNRTNVAAIGVPAVVVALALLIIIWLCKKKNRGKDHVATVNFTLIKNKGEGQEEGVSDSGSKDRSASDTSDSSKAATNSNRQSLTPTETPISGTPDAVPDEHVALLVEETSPSMTPHDDGALTGGAQGHDSPTVNGSISNHLPDIMGADDGEENEEPDTDTDLNRCPLSTEESSEKDETSDVFGLMKKIGGEDRTGMLDRPAISRSQSVPATFSKSNETSEEKGNALLILPKNTHKKLVEMKHEDGMKKFDEDLQTASRIGQGFKWQDFELKFRIKINQMMKSENKVKDFLTFGEMMGLNRNTDLKDCSDLTEVFDKLSKSLGAEVFMDKVLVTLRDMERNDIVREIIKELKKPTRKQGE